MAFIFGYPFTDYTPTATTEDSTNYGDDNLKIYGFLRRQWRSSNTSQTTISCAFGSSKAIVGVVLDDVNFTSVTVGGTAFTVAQDTRVERYKIYAAKTATGSSMDIVIPNQTPTDGLSKFRMGRLIFLASSGIISLSANISWPYDYSAAKPYKTNEFESGGRETVKLGDYKVFQCGFKFMNIDDAYESQIWSLDNIDEDEEFVMYENDGDTSKVYVCHRVGSIIVTEPTFGIRQTSGITIKEVI